MIKKIPTSTKDLHITKLTMSKKNCRILMINREKLQS